MNQEVKVEVRDKRRIKSAEDTYDETLDAQAASAESVARTPVSAPVDEARLSEYIAAYREKMAEMDRVRRRLEADSEDRAKRKFGALVAELLPILDDFNRAIEHAPNAGSDDGFLAGLIKLRDGFVTTLIMQGLEILDLVNQPFDPSVAQAVAVTPVDDESMDGIVVEQYAPAYVYEGHVLRHALVRVAKKD